MYRILIPLFAITLLVAGCPTGGGDTKTAGGSTAVKTGGDTGSGTTAPVKTTPVVKTPVQRGEEIYNGTEYSNTSLSCADCHSASVADEASRIFIAHSGHGAFKRGAWKITKQEQLDAGEGYAKTLLDACNACVKAPYMNHGDELIAGEDGDALLAYLESIATDDEPFIIARTTEMPVGGLTPDKAHGQQIYEQSCAQCHGKLDGIEDLTGASEWLEPMQVMAKVRKIGNGEEWYEDFEGMEYAVSHVNYLALFGVGTAHAEENPCGDNPCGENPCGESHEGHDHDDDHGMFSEGAMPFFGTDILSDQDVVDVSFYVAEDL